MNPIPTQAKGRFLPSLFLLILVSGCEDSAPRDPHLIEPQTGETDTHEDPHTDESLTDIDCPEPPGPEEHDLLGALRTVPCGTQTLRCHAKWDGPAWVWATFGGSDEGSVMLRDCAPVGTPLDLSQPEFRVSLTRNLWMMRSEVTQEMWMEVWGANPSAFGGEGEPPAWPDDAPGDPVAPSCEEDCPVESVTWWAALAFANAVSERDGLAPCYRLVGCEEEATAGAALVCEGVEVTAPGRDPYACEGWRLPLRAEWDRAAVGGQDHLFAGSDDPTTVAWFQGPNFYRAWSSVLDDQDSWWGVEPPPEDLARIFGPQRVCSTGVNGYDLCDLSGNVEEWIWGGLHRSTVAEDMAFPVGTHHVDPPAAALAMEYGRPVRDHSLALSETFVGGSWQMGSFERLVVWRKTLRWEPGYRGPDIGFRLVRSVD